MGFSPLRALHYVGYVAATVNIEVRDGFVLVRQTGALDLLEAEDMQRRVELAIATATARRVIFDNRETLAPEEGVRARMHAWVTSKERFERAALVLESEMLKIGVNMDAVSKGLHMKAFNDLDEAIAWVSR